MEPSPPAGRKPAEKIRDVLSKYYSIEIFQEDPYLFEPICVIMVKMGSPPANFDAMQIEMRELGYYVQFSMELICE